MDHFNYRGGKLFVEDVPISEIVEQYGTPAYVYSRATLERHWHAFNDAFEHHPHMICYAVKANSNLAVLNCLARLGSGFDVVSQGELERVIHAGGKPSQIIFSGVGKSDEEIVRALSLGIFCLNVESEAELERIAFIAERENTTAPIAFRVNPNVDPKTHPYISTGLKENKFGIDYDNAVSLYRKASRYPHINILGVACHIGSQITTLSPFIDALDKMLLLIQKLQAENIHLTHLDLGGGLGVRYQDEDPLEPSEYVAAIQSKMQNNPITIILEPGRAIAANAGVLLTKVEYLKKHDNKNFAIVDAGMTDLLRPSLYGAWHDIIHIHIPFEEALQTYDIVGPVCETGDFIGKDRELSLSAGDILAVRSAGAYGFSMSSNYNTRRRACEIMVDINRVYCVRSRETYTELFNNEFLLP